MLLRILKNRYFWVLLAFAVWLLFFDKNNFFETQKSRQALKKLEQENAYYEKEIERVRQERDELFTNNQTLEKFAREKYFMKKENEDLFVIMDTTSHSEEKSK